MSLKETLDELNNNRWQGKAAQLLSNQIAAYIICDINNSNSTAGARRVVQSIIDTDSNLMPVIVPATTPETLKRDLRIFGLEKKDWKYPRKGEKRIDFTTGLHLTGYGANDIEKVISCMVSHMRCWMFSMATQFPSIVLEHDALFVKRFNAFENIEKDQPDKYEVLNSLGIVGLNNPKGATRKASVYYDEVLKLNELRGRKFSGYKAVDVPWVDDNKDAPQGLAGNSAYYITNKMAHKLLRKIQEVGIWPNDALMCKQLFPNQIKQIYPFVTELQGIKSTTQG